LLDRGIVRLAVAEGTVDPADVIFFTDMVIDRAQHKTYRQFFAWLFHEMENWNGLLQQTVLALNDAFNTYYQMPTFELNECDQYLIVEHMKELQAMVKTM